MVYQGLIMRVGITGGNVFVDFLIASLVEFPAAFIILLTIERIGRRLPFAAANIVAGASCLITAFIPDSEKNFLFLSLFGCHPPPSIPGSVSLCLRYALVKDSGGLHRPLGDHHGV